MHICADEILQIMMGLSLIGGAVTVVRMKLSEWRARWSKGSHTKHTKCSHNHDEDTHG